MNILVSGAAARAVFIEGEKLFYVDADSLDKVNSARISDLPNLLGDASDTVELQRATKEDGLSLLNDLWSKDRALRMLQIALDPIETIDTVSLAIESLDAFLDDDTVDEHISNIAYAWPIIPAPEITRLQVILNEKPNAERLLSSVATAQDAICRVRHAWENISVSLFEPPSDKPRVEFNAVRDGLFRELVFAIVDNGKTDRAVFRCYVALVRVVGYRDIVAAWIKNIGIHPGQQIDDDIVLNMQSERDFAEAVREIEVRDAGDIYEQVKGRQRGIVDRLERGDLTNARKFTNELVEYQIAHGGSNFAAKSLCALSHKAKKLGYASLQLEWVTTATEVAPYDAWAHGQAGEAYFDFYRFEDARRSYQKALVFGDEQYGLVGRGRLLRATGRLDDALEVFKSARERLPTHPEAHRAWAGIAATLRDMGRLDEALEVYSTAVEKFPLEEVVWCGRAAVLKELGHLDDANKCFQEVAQLFPESAYAIAGIAESFKDVGDFEMALKTYDNAIGSFPGNAIIHCGRADVLRKMGRLNDALRAYEDTIQKFDHEPSAYGGRAETLRDLGQFRGALEAYDEAIDRFEHEAHLRNGRANMLKIAGELENSLQAYDENVRDFPYNCISLSGRALLLKELGKNHDALRAFDALIERRPDYAAASYGKAALLVILRRYEEAGDLLPTAHPRTRDEWIAHHIRGMIFLRQGQIEEAVDHFQFGLANNPFYRSRKYYENAMAAAQIAQRDFEAALSHARHGQNASAKILEFHSAAAVGNLKIARACYDQLITDPHPNVVTLSIEIAAQFGISDGAAKRDPNWILDQEAETILALAA